MIEFDTHFVKFIPESQTEWFESTINTLTRINFSSRTLVSSTLASWCLLVFTCILRGAPPDTRNQKLLTYSKNDSFLYCYSYSKLDM